MDKFILKVRRQVKSRKGISETLRRIRRNFIVFLNFSLMRGFVCFLYYQVMSAIDVEDMIIIFSCLRFHVS